MVEETYREILDIDVREEELVEDKVVKIGLAVKGYKEKFFAVQFKFEMEISELQMKLQSTMP